MSDRLERYGNYCLWFLLVMKKIFWGVCAILYFLMVLPLALLMSIGFMSGLLSVVILFTMYCVPDPGIRFLGTMALLFCLFILWQSVTNDYEYGFGSICVGIVFAIAIYYSVAILRDLRTWLDCSTNVHAVYSADGKEFLGCTQAKGYHDFEVKKALTPWNCKLVPAPSVADYVEVNWTDQVGKPWEVFVMKYYFKTQSGYIKAVEEYGGNIDDKYKAKVYESMEHAVLQVVGDLTEVPRDEAKIKELAVGVKTKLQEAFPELDIIVGACDPMQLDPQLEKRLQQMLQ